MLRSKQLVESEVGVRGALLKRKDFLGVDELAHSHPNRTYYYRKNQDLNDIIDTCTKKLESDPTNSQALFLRGTTYSKKRTYQASVRDFDILLRNQPNHLEGLYNRAVALTKIEQTERAIEDFSRVLAINPDHVNAAFARATCYNKIGQLDKAIEDYNLALMGQRLADDLENTSHTVSPVQSEDFTGNDGDLSRLTYQNDGEGSPAMVARGGGRTYSEQGDSGSNSPLSVRSSGRFSNYHQYSPAATPTVHGGAARHGFGANPANDNSSYMQPMTPGLNRSRVNSASGNSLDMLNTSSTARPNSLGPRGVSGSSVLSSSSSNNYIAHTPAPTSQSQGTTSNPVAEEHHARGYQLRKQNKFTEAIQEYSLAIAADPRHFKALFNRGFAHDKLGLFDLAIADYTRAIEIDSSNSFCYYNRGISNDRKGTLDRAMQDFTTAINLQPNNAEFYNNRAFCARKLGKLQDALTDYNTSLQLLPNNFKALYNRAGCLEKLDQLEAAMADCTAALAVQPKHGGCLLTRATLLDRTNQLSDAVEAYTVALQHHAEPFAALSGRARVLSRLSRYAEAINDFSAALEIQSKDSELLFARALCHKALEQYDNAIRDFTVVVSADPKNATAFNHRGYCYRKVELYDNAIADYSKCIQLTPGNVRAHNNRAYILAKLGRFEEAVEDYTVVIKYEPRSVHAYHNRGISYDKLGLIDQAIADFTKVLELEPQSYGDGSTDGGNSGAQSNRQAATDAMHHLQQQQQALLAAQAAFAQGGQGTQATSLPPPPPPTTSEVMSTPAPVAQPSSAHIRNNAPLPVSVVNRLPSAMKAPNLNASSTSSANNTSTLGSSGVQIQNGSFYVPRGTVSSEIKPTPKHIERQRRPSVELNTNNSNLAQTAQRTSSRESEETNSTDTGLTSEIDETALAQHTELGNRLSQMSNLLKGFGAPVIPPAVVPVSRHPANASADVASSSRPVGSVYRAPVPLGGQEQKPNEVVSNNIASNNGNSNYNPPQPRLPSAVVPSKWANRMSSAQHTTQGENKSHLSIDTSTISTQSKTSPVLSIDTPVSTPLTSHVNNGFNSNIGTPGSARNGPVSASAFLNSLKKPPSASTDNNAHSLGSAGEAHKFSSQGSFTPRANDYNHS